MCVGRGPGPFPLLPIELQLSCSNGFPGSVSSAPMYFLSLRQAVVWEEGGMASRAEFRLGVALDSVLQFLPGFPPMQGQRGARAGVRARIQRPG